MAKDIIPEWEITKPLKKLKDDRPYMCQSCDYDWYDDCTEGCMMLKQGENNE